jgi:HEAT repeat protein
MARVSHPITSSVPEPAFVFVMASKRDSLGEPSIEVQPTWYPNADTVACWKRDDKTLALILESDARAGATVLLWCVSDAEMAALEESTRTRVDRIAAGEFDRYFHQQIARLAEPCADQILTRKMLVDDLAVIPDQAIRLLGDKLADPNGEVRCAVADVLFELGGGLRSIRCLLDDPEDHVRSHVISLLSYYGDDSAVEPLMAKLHSDPDPSVRGAAAFALGHIGSPQAIPSLLKALDHDHEYDEQGHSPSSTSATALDNILGTNQTRIKHEGSERQNCTKSGRNSWAAHEQGRPHD